ncbi:MAG: hypothetical protein Q9202_001481 [Teloschistes flavicans]
MPSLGSFGPLDALLLLQRIQYDDSTPLSFDILAKYLKTTKNVLRGGTSNSDHIEPRSLELLYRKLLKEEVKLEIQKNRASSPLPDGPQNPRKRKLSSPPLDTLEEASHYKHLIPQVAARIYDEYRDSATKRIEDEERKYRLLRKDIQEIERGEWDTRLQPDGMAKGKDSQGVSSIQTLLQDKLSEPEMTPLKAANGLSSSPLPPIERMLPSQNFSPSAPLWDNQPPSLPNANGSIAILAPATPGATSQEPASASSVSPRRAQQTSYVTHEVPSNVSRPSSQPGSAANGAPFYTPPSHNLQGYHKPSTPPNVQGRQPSQPANIAPAPISRLHQAPLPPSDRSSGSPIILPPPPGMLRATSSPTGPLDAFADVNGQQFRSSSMSSPRLPHPPHPPQYPAAPNYASQAYQYHQYENMASFQNPYQPPYNQGPPTPIRSQKHTPIAPYHQTNSNNGQNPYYTPIPSYQPPAPHAQYPSHSNGSPFIPQRAVAPSFSQYPAPPRPLDQKTPIRTSNAKRQLPKPSPINTSVSSTKWKNVEAHGEVQSPRSPIQPRPEEISPLSEKAPSPVFRSSEHHRAGAVGQVAIASLAAEDTPTPSDIPPPAKRGSRRRPRGTSTRKRGARGASTASSTYQTGTRSGSVASGADADELSLEPPTSTTTRTAIKHETPATPAALRDSSASIPPTATSEIDSSRKSTRRRRETLRGPDLVDNTRASTKRKRANTLDTSEAESKPTSHSAEFEKQKEELSATHILASRNFTRTSATLMNDIAAHKFAGIFAKPLTLPGYNSIIYRRQDLKSIKSAITNGGRSLAAILEQERDNDDKAIVPVAGAGGSDTRIWAKKTDDIVPPKGIVNSVQLEKEVMRMFANAVMFNPDPHRSLVGPAYSTRAKTKERHIPPHLTDQEEDEDEADVVREEDGGVVKDAREMFEDVDRVVGEWRAAERAAEEKAAAVVTMGKIRGGDEEEADELAGDDSAVAVEEKPERSGERPGKRRRR